MNQNSDYRIVTDKSALQPERIHNFLTNSYWVKGIKLTAIEKLISNSDCFGVFCGETQIGFARVISDYVRLAYLMDVYIEEEHRGKGLSKQLLAFIFEHPRYSKVQKWMLATRDAHELYKKFGFIPLTAPERFMEKSSLPAV
jgi:GNAT superfamily N-acetyltransferase